MAAGVNRAPFWLDPAGTHTPFPPAELALDEPNGLLAVGGDLSPQRIVRAYRNGIFPWYSSGQPILWWSPNPRAVLIPSQLRVSRSLRKTMRKQPFQITIDRCFADVLRQCAAPRSYADGTWITPEMQAAYLQLHALGIAHSFESWQDGELAGGLYGLAIGRVFFGESMFSRVTDASKIAFVHATRQLQRWGYALIDCQVASDHLHSFGAIEMARSRFVAELSRLTNEGGRATPWRFDGGFDPLEQEQSDAAAR